MCVVVVGELVLILNEGVAWTAENLEARHIGFAAVQDRGHEFIQC